MQATAGIAVLVGLFVGVACALVPGLDLAVSSLFYNAKSGFVLSDIGWIRTLRWFLMHVPHLVTLLALLALIGNAMGLPLARRLPTRSALFLLSTLIVIPGLLVNDGLKDNWGRPRPTETHEFGGAQAFWPWWRPGGPCDQNCSFVSGEVSATAWLTAAASLTPPTIRPAIMGAAVVATGISAFLRVAFGRHWFSDVVLGAVLTILLIAVAHRLFFGPFVPLPLGARSPKRIKDDLQL